MFRGNFSIKDKLNEKIALTNATVTQQSAGWAIRFTRGDAVSATLLVGVDAEGRLELKLKNDAASHNRIWLRLAAQPDDHIYGCGEQFSYFDLRGKPFRCGPASRAWAAISRPTSPAGRLQRERGRRLLLDLLPAAYLREHPEVLLPRG